MESLSVEAKDIANKLLRYSDVMPSKHYELYIHKNNQIVETNNTSKIYKILKKNSNSNDSLMESLKAARTFQDKKYKLLEV